MVSIYLDVSCLHRPDDDQNQSRVRLETEAISIIMERIEDGHWRQLASDMVIVEINANRDLSRRRRALALLPGASDIVPLNETMWSRAGACERMGFKPADAVHVAAAEEMKADVLLTCDDRMLKTAARNRSRLHVRLANPLTWLKEQDDDANT